MQNQMNAACRVALLGLVNGIGRFARRAGAEETFFDMLQKVVPDELEPAGSLSDILATASRVASGQSDADPSTAVESMAVRLASLFEEIALDDKTGAACRQPKYGMPLAPLSPKALFPQPLSTLERGGAGDYQALWRKFEDGLTRESETAVPEAFRRNWQLWLDSFDTGWLTYAGAVPNEAVKGVVSDVSLYDHGKATAAVATALWGWQAAEDREDDGAADDWNCKKMLLIQGDFFGIQNFIFSEGRSTNKKAAQILRGRSFYVSLLSELAALKVLQALNLPPTSQILNAAGKFLIVAPNTRATKDKLQKVRQELDAWFVKNTFAVAGIGLVSTEASCADFTDGHYPDLTKRLFAELDKAKCRRFDLVHFENPVLDADYSKGVCDWQARLPADQTEGSGEEASASCALSRDQILIGRCLPTFKRILIATESADLRRSQQVQCLELPVFGFKVAFVQDAAQCGDFGDLARSGELLRCWDFSLAESEDEPLWKGYARRNINGYVPCYSEADIAVLGEDKAEGRVAGRAKLFADIASADSHDGKGIKALMTVKGDVDNLGLIFQKGLSSGGRNATFAKTAALSREMNAFFAVWLPWVCRKDFPNTYTVFAGGDDFFMVGPWKEAQKLVKRLSEDFAKYVVNDEVHFSVGTTVTKSTVPVSTLAETAEESLSCAKSVEGKNALALYGKTVRWTELAKLAEAEAFLSQAAADYGVTSGYLYKLFEILEMAGRKDSPEASIWRSRLYYRTARLFERQHLAEGASRQKACSEFLTTLLHYLEEQGAAFRIPLTNVFYSIREAR